MRFGGAETRSGPLLRMNGLARRRLMRETADLFERTGESTMLPMSEPQRDAPPPASSRGSAPFAAFRDDVRAHAGLRARIDAMYRAPETACVPALVAAATLPAPVGASVRALARRLVEGLRARPPAGLVQGLMHEYALSSQEGVALMCLAEALLRIPDRATRDALIADKIGGGEWRAHIGQSPSPFVNAATWGLLITGRLVGTFDETGLGATLTRLIAASGAPIIRASVDTAMRVMGEQFVCGETIDAALQVARRRKRRAFAIPTTCSAKPRRPPPTPIAITTPTPTRFMPSAPPPRGAASTRGPACRSSFRRCIRATSARSAAASSGNSPRLKGLMLLARRYDVGINIDAEESERLDLSLDLLEALCGDPDLAGWNGVGFVVQAYQKRSLAVLEFIIDLARRTRRRIMVRLVKGAYWDSEIKRAQVEGLEGFPVFTRKRHTDVSYIACARLLLGARARSIRNSRPTTP